MNETHRDRKPKTLVSVIMIFLNAERFIQEAIESVFAQTYPAWELLLVDDGSTDGSPDIAREYAARHPGKVFYLQHADGQNHGMSASRNLGIANATGDFIAFLDADDVWSPHKLERQVAVLERETKASMVYGPTRWWYCWTGRAEDRQRDFIHELGITPETLVEPPELLTRFLSKEGISPCTCSVLLRREAVEQVKGFEEEFRGLYEDQAFFAKICLAAPVYVMHECLARYRQHSSSNCSVTQDSEEYRLARSAFLSWLVAYLDQQGAQDAQLLNAVEHEMWQIEHPVSYGLLQAARPSRLGQLYRSALNLRLRWLSLPLFRHLRSLQFRRLNPLANGQQRGTPIVRHYWAQYLQQHRADIHGTGLEIGTTATIRQYGGQALTRAEAIDLAAHSPEVTVVADLSRADHVPSDRYDCFVNQFSMHLIFDVRAALYHSIRILRPGGVLLINFSCLDYYFPSGLDMGTGAPLFMYWWFTPVQVENLFRSLDLDESDYNIAIYGNLFTRIAYQLNLPAEELTRHELVYKDPGHPLLIGARVVKPVDWQVARPEYQEPWRPDSVPARWDPVTGHYAAQVRSR